MALINCPECNNEISDTVKKCPHCGYKIKGNNKKVKKPIIIAGCIAVLVIVAVLLCIIISKNAVHKHKWEEASCTEPKTCTECGETEGLALGHSFGALVVVEEPSCIAEGKEQKECSECGEIVSSKIKKTSHVAGEWQIDKEASFDEDGEKSQYCDVCGEKIKTEEYSLSKAEKADKYKAACKDFAYSDYIRNINNVVGDYCKSYGQVEQVLLADDGTYNARVYLTFNNTLIQYWTDDVWILYYPELGEEGIAEGDMITFYGEVLGSHTYDTIGSGSRTLPLIDVEYITVGENETSIEINTTNDASYAPFLESNNSSSSNSSSGNSQYNFTTDIHCIDVFGLKVSFVESVFPRGSLSKDEVGLKFLVENTSSSDMVVMINKMAINGFTMNDARSAGASVIAGGTKGYVECKAKIGDLEDFGITNIESISAVVHVNGKGNSDRFTIDIN